jgi:hypothetical protein
MAMNQPLNNQELEALLPWYLNNTLSADERQQVENWLQESEQAQDALAQLQLIQKQVQDEDAITAPVDMGWQRFKQQLPISAPQTNQSSFRWQRLVATAAAVVIAVQFALLINLQDNQDTRLLSGDGTIVTAPVTGLLIKVMPADDANWQALQALLLQADATIIAGPSAMGLLTLHITDSPESSAQVQLLESSPLIGHVQVLENE